MSFAAALIGALFAEAEQQGVDLLALADRLGCAPYALTEPDGFRSLLICELEALCKALDVRPSVMLAAAS